MSKVPEELSFTDKDTEALTCIRSHSKKASCKRQGWSSDCTDSKADTLKMPLLTKESTTFSKKAVPEFMSSSFIYLLSIVLLSLTSFSWSLSLLEPRHLLLPVQIPCSTRIMFLNSSSNLVTLLSKSFQESEVSAK